MTETYVPGGTTDRTHLAGRLLEHIDAGSTDRAPEVMRFRPTEYTDPALLDRELDLIFGRVPVIAAHTSELPNPHDFLSVRLPRNEALLVRQGDGRVKAFINACRHRGSMVVAEECGNSRLFACPYHKWTYNADGSLRWLADQESFGEVDTSTLGLVELPAEERHGFVWVLDNPRGTLDLGAWLGPEMEAVLASYHLDTHVLFRKLVVEEPDNWKVLVDSFTDSYHVKYLHAATSGPYVQHNTVVMEEFGPHARFTTGRTSIAAARHDPDDSIADHIVFGNLFMPCHQMLAHADHYELMSFLPHPTDPARTRMVLHHLIPEPITTERQQRRWEKSWSLLTATTDEDKVVNRNLQKAVTSKDVPELHIGRNEVVVSYFHRQVAKLMSGSV